MPKINIEMYGKMPYILKMKTYHVQPPDNRRDGRLDLRISAVSKDLLERAAALANRSVTDLVVQSACAEAERIIQEHEVLTLQGSARDAFMAALLEPPKANANLAKAIAEYKKVLK